MFTSILSAVALVAVTCVSAETQQVVVGMNMTRSFYPNSITASVGDVVNFTFVAGNHSLVQSTFAMPCNFTNGTIDSGYMPANITAGRTSSYQVTINNTNPLWFHCSQGNHCQVGMVMAINAPTSGNMTFTSFQAAANATGANTTSATPSSSASGSMTSMMSSSASGTGSSAAATTSKASAEGLRSVSGLGGALLAVGGALLVAL